MTFLIFYLTFLRNLHQVSERLILSTLFDVFRISIHSAALGS